MYLPKSQVLVPKVSTICLLLCLALTACAEGTPGGGTTGGATTGGPLLDAGQDAGQDAGTDAGGNTGACTYPALDAGVLPDVPLGVGYLNWDGTKNPAIDPTDGGGADAGMGSAADVLAWLHCSGFRYLLLDLTTNYCPGSHAFAQSAPSQVGEWLDAGGTVLSVMELSQTGLPVTPFELEQWSREFGLNFALVTDPTQGLTSFFDVQAWPTSAFVDLRTMQVLWFEGGSGADAAYTFSIFLDAGELPHAGPQ